MKLILISNQVEEIRLAIQHGIRTVLIDLERETKLDRQAGKGLFISDHTILDLQNIRQQFPTLEIITRVNSRHAASEAEVAEVIAAGTDAIMIPYFHEPPHLQYFYNIIKNRLDIIPLFETIRSVEQFSTFQQTFPFTRCHFGLNDLRLEHRWNTIFKAFEWQPFLEALAAARAAKLEFGIAGVGNQLDDTLPVHPQAFFRQQLALGGTSFWLSRHFRQIFQMPDASEVLQQNIQLLQQFYAAAS